MKDHSDILFQVLEVFSNIYGGVILPAPAPVDRWMQLALSLLNKIEAVSRAPIGTYPRTTLAACAMKEPATAPP